MRTHPRCRENVLKNSQKRIKVIILPPKNLCPRNVILSSLNTGYLSSFTLLIVFLRTTNTL
ncbi:hypothetical protein LDG_5355 [Legionella drancourtii LLAP12]|uniref:Uncharacterized protein n=1 Tax=Legionella drancourtii LLAP12 TaxID=658187 RepID=G9EJJ0_9GAMM|nr:hypothetical protein LDG_5355 [Legionella drancourtii LLAP12]